MAPPMILRQQAVALRVVLTAAWVTAHAVLQLDRSPLGVVPTQPPRVGRARCPETGRTPRGHPRDRPAGRSAAAEQRCVRDGVDEQVLGRGQLDPGVAPHRVRGHGSNGSRGVWGSV